MERHVVTNIERWGTWTPGGPVDPDLFAVVDIALDDEGVMTAGAIALGPRMADATPAEVGAFVDDEVTPRVQDLLIGEERHTAWRQVTAGHWQTHLTWFEWPDLDDQSTPKKRWWGR